MFPLKCSLWASVKSSLSSFSNVFRANLICSSMGSGSHSDLTYNLGSKEESEEEELVSEVDWVSPLGCLDFSCLTKYLSLISRQNWSKSTYLVYELGFMSIQKPNPKPRMSKILGGIGVLLLQRLCTTVCDGG